jgi:hypothetical protein
MPAPPSELTRMNQRRIFVEITWRLSVVALAVTLQAASMLVLRPFFGGRFWPAVSGGRVEFHPAGVAILAGFWILGGAFVRTIFFHRRLILMLPLRAIALLAGSLAVMMSFQVVMSIGHSGWPLQVSMGIVSMFSLAMYGCWRWISLLLAVIEDAGGWRDGWQAFVRLGFGLAVTAATNSTLKWFFLAATALPGVWLLQRGMWTVAAFWAPLPVGVSGYFAARLRESIRELL